jgi:guanosine-3',5'-bis(diphosphate) 3'-pyrophosphohydrolase
MKVFDAWRTWTDAEPPLRDRLPAEVVNRLALAYQAAVDWHGDQVRPAGEPYVEHLLQALQIAVEVGGETSADVLMVKLSDRYSNVQALDTHPRPDKRARYYAETVRWIVPLTARVPQFVSLFAQWQQYYSRLADEQERTSHA